MNIVGQLFARGGGGFGGPRPPKEADPITIPDRAPDVVHEMKIPENQTLIYRLSGDTMPQHVDLELAKANKWEKPIGRYSVVAIFFLRRFAHFLVEHSQSWVSVPTA